MQKSVKYLIAIACLVLFVSCDLMFDYAFDFNGSDSISFGFTSISAILVFIFTGKLAQEQKGGYYKASKFIQSNFDKVQVTFSILDVICGLISICAGLTFLISVKIIKLIYIPIKILVVLNKEKSILKPIAKFSLMWVFTRNVRNSKGEEMAEEKTGVVETVQKTSFFAKVGKAIKSACKYIFVSNPKASATTLVNGFASSCAGYALSVNVECLPQLNVGGFDFMALIVAIVLFSIVEVFGINYAFESNTDADTRKAEEKVVKTEKANAKAEEKAQKEYAKSVEQEAKKQIEAQKATQTAEEQAKFKADVQAKIAELQKEESK